MRDSPSSSFSAASFQRSLETRIADRLSGWLDRLQLPEEVILIGTALLVGLGTGGAGVAFQYLILGVSWVGYEWFPHVAAQWGKAYAVLIPTLGGLAAGPLIYYFAREAKGHGVPEVMEAVALRGGHIRPIVAFIKAVASSLTIGSGGSAGREGPIVQIGAALGSTFGQALHLSDERIRNLVACGAAGGIAAVFNAPIAGVIFAMEVILGEFSVRYFSTVVISAVAASAVSQAVWGTDPIFGVPVEYQLNSAWEFAFYPVLGVLAAVAGAAFVRILYWTEDLFDHWRHAPEWLKPAIGGFLLGVLALVYPLVTGFVWIDRPPIFNVGYNVVVENALSGQLILGLVVTLLVLKPIATSLTLGSGGSGGVFAPSLFQGAMLGTAFGLLLNRLLPGIPALPGAYALVGMAAVFAAAAHAPITAVLILFEMTGDYRIILPLMLTVVIATLVSQWILKGESIYTLKLTRRGVRLQHGRDLDVMQGVTVAEIMSQDVDTVPHDLTLPELSERFSQTRHHGFPVLDNVGRLWGVVTIEDLQRAISRNLPRRTTVAEIGTHEPLLVAYPDEPMGAVLARLSTRGIGRLPVVDRDDPRHLVGLVRRNDIVNAYRVALARRAELQHRTKRMQLRNLDGTEFVELTLKEGDRAVGLAVSAIADLMPHDCVLVSIRRGPVILIPHGDTVLQADDHITAFVDISQTEKLHHCLHGASETASS